jgi:hypothetical protein
VLWCFFVGGGCRVSSSWLVDAVGGEQCPIIFMMVQEYVPCWHSRSRMDTAFSLTRWAGVVVGGVLLRFPPRQSSVRP